MVSPGMHLVFHTTKNFFPVRISDNIYYLSSFTSLIFLKMFVNSISLFNAAYFPTLVYVQSTLYTMNDVQYSLY